MEFKPRQEPEVKQRRGHTYRQWIVAIIANCSLLTYGLQAGWISPMTQVLQSPSSPAGAPLSASTMGLVASLMPISAMLTVPIFAYIADKYGRKAGIMCITVPHAVRAKLLSMIVAQAWLLTFVQLAAFAPLTTFYVFAAVNLFGVYVVLVLMPETRGKSDEEIEAMLRND